MDSDPSKTPIDEIKALLEKTLDRVDQNAQRFERADADRIAFQARSEDRSRVTGEAVAGLVTRVSKLEEAVPEAAKLARESDDRSRKAMQSSHDLARGLDDVQRAVHDTIDPKLDALAKHLEKQDTDTEKREREKREQREAESLAAKRVAEKRDFYVKLFGIGAPVLTAVIALVGIMYQSTVASKTQEATVKAQEAARATQETSIATRQRVEQLAADRAPALPAASSSAQAPASTAAPARGRP